MNAIARISPVMPSIALLLGALQYSLNFFDRFASPNQIRKNPIEGGQGSVAIRQVVAVLQLVVGALVTLGGGAFAAFALNSFGMELGLIHFSVGVACLVVGVVAYVKKDMPANLILGVDALMITYSTFSESLVQIESLLPQSASMDSLVGTVIAIAMGVAIIGLVLGKHMRGAQNTRSIA